MRLTIARALCALLLPLTALPAAAETKLLRFPDLHGDRVAFSYAGDLWTAPAAGGTAVRLTAHPGQELFPKFSPDGAWIAFTGNYDGNTDVFIVPASGGVPERLTFHPETDTTCGWTPDGKAVLFSSGRASVSPRSRMTVTLC